MTLEQVFPGLSSSPGGSILGLVDNIFDITGPSQQLTSSLNTDHIRMLLRQIRSIDPKYRYDFLEQTLTLEGQINAIRQLRAERAAVLFRVRGDSRLLQVETVRFMQEKADLAYDEAVHLYNAGRLKPKLSRNEAIGNRVDRVVRRELRNFYRGLGIDISKGETVRVIGREYDSSGSDLTYRIPDARVGDIAFDVTLTQKTLSTPQIRGFFNADFQPAAIVIIRPRQLGPNNTYAIRQKDK